MTELFDLHIHTFFSDGQRDFDPIIQTLIKNKVKIAGFADHIFPGCLYRHPETGLSYNYRVSQLKYRKNYIRYLDRKYPEIRLLNGGEIDIYPHGTLSLPKGITPAFFDYLTVAKHHTLPITLPIWKKHPKMEKWLWTNHPKFKLKKQLWYSGLEAAFQRYKPDIFAHLQEGIPKCLSHADLKRIIYLSVKYGVAIELNHFPMRELRPLLPLAKRYGVKFSLASDFHGFGDKFEENLMHSQKMLDIAQEYGLELINPAQFLPENNHRGMID